LSIAFEEVSVEKIVPIELPDEPEIEEVIEAEVEAEVLTDEESGDISPDDDESA
jgi:hypothetical protein